MTSKTSDRRRAPRGRSSGQDGFVLVAVLALLVVLALLASAVALISQRAVAEAQTEIERFQSDVDMVSTRDTVLFMLSTQRKTMGGLTVDETRGPTSTGGDILDGPSALPIGNEIRLDNTAYRGLGNVHFSLVDERGLISPNWVAPSVMQRFYEQRGVPAHEWAGLEAKRLDYQDPDPLHRLGGAEEDHYLKAGKRPPTNRAMSTPLELRQVMGWDDLLKGLDDEQVLNLFSIGQTSVINLNSASAPVLSLVPGMDAAQAERLVTLRNATPMTSTWDVISLFPATAAFEDIFVLFSNPSGNLTLWDGRLGAKRLTHWSLTPLDEAGRPWRIDYEVILPRGKESAQALARTPATPLFPAAAQAGP